MGDVGHLARLKVEVLPQVPWQLDGYREGSRAAVAADYRTLAEVSVGLIAVPYHVPREYMNTWAEAWEHGYAETAWQCGAP